MAQHSWNLVIEENQEFHAGNCNTCFRVGEVSMTCLPCQRAGNQGRFVRYMFLRNTTIDWRIKESTQYAILVHHKLVPEDPMLEESTADYQELEEVVEDGVRAVRQEHIDDFNEVEAMGGADPLDDNDYGFDPDLFPL